MFGFRRPGFSPLCWAPSKMVNGLMTQTIVATIAPMGTGGGWKACFTRAERATHNDQAQLCGAVRVSTVVRSRFRRSILGKCDGGRDLGGSATLGEARC